MRKHILTIALATISMAAQAQWMRVWQNGESTRYAISEAASTPYATAGSTVQSARRGIRVSAIVNPPQTSTATSAVSTAAKGRLSAIHAANVMPHLPSFSRDYTTERREAQAYFRFLYEVLSIYRAVSLAVPRSVLAKKSAAASAMRSLSSAFSA